MQMQIVILKNTDATASVLYLILSKHPTQKHKLIKINTFELCIINLSLILSPIDHINLEPTCIK